MKKFKELLKNEKVQQGIKEVLISLSALLALIFSLTACSVTRTMTTTSQSFTRGDTSTVIQTKTIETVTLKQDLKQ